MRRSFLSAATMCQWDRAYAEACLLLLLLLAARAFSPANLPSGLEWIARLGKGYVVDHRTVRMGDLQVLGRQEEEFNDMSALEWSKQ
jgi:hypothetical protein